MVEESAKTPSHQRKHDSQGFRSLIWSFVLSLALTAFAFIAVGARPIQDPLSLSMFILLLAAIQAAFQLLYFMHLHEKGHRFPLLFIGSGLFVAIVVAIGTMDIW